MTSVEAKSFDNVGSTHAHPHMKRQPLLALTSIIDCLLLKEYDQFSQMNIKNGV